MNRIQHRAIRTQRGAIAVLFGIALLVLLLACGLVLDLGHLTSSSRSCKMRPTARPWPGPRN